MDCSPERGNSMATKPLSCRTHLGPCHGKSTGHGLLFESMHTVSQGAVHSGAFCARASRASSSNRVSGHEAGLHPPP
jgi:hypothetical protein